MFQLGGRGGAVSWLVVFLGNPGAQYQNTRHNCGFMAADAVEKKTGVRIDRLRFKALTARCTLGGESVLLMKPQTYMNLSGEAAAPAARFYKIPPERVLAVSDDAALPPGKLRIRKSGSAGGQKGLQSLIEHLGTDAFPRVRIGIGAPEHPDYDMADWVLGVPRGKDAELILSAARRAADALEAYIRDGADKAMALFN